MSERPTAIIYTRQSLDPTGEGHGVARQKADCTALCRARGWTVVEVIEDNDTSASKGRREGFEALLAAMAQRRAAVVVVWHLDRLTRTMTDLERVIEISEASGVKVATVSGDIDLSTDMGRTIGRILAAVARGEVERKSARQKAANQQRAEAGLPYGCRRVYGYEPGGMQLREQEAVALKDMASQFLSGHSYQDIADQLNRNGHLTTTGKSFHQITVRALLRNQRYAGLRTYGGKTYRGAWPAIFDEETWARLQYRMKDCSQSRSPRFLLTGFIYCGECGQPMNGDTRQDRRGGPRRVYRCMSAANKDGRKGCGGVLRAAEPLEHFVRELIIYRLDTPDLEALLAARAEHSETADLLDQKAALEDRMASLLDDYADGTLTKPEYIRAKDRAATRLAATDERLRDLHQKQTLGGLVGSSGVLRRRWQAESDGWRRQVIRMLIGRIDVHRANKQPAYDLDGRTVRFDPSAVDVRWLL